MSQTSAFWKGAAVASSLTLGGGYVALRAGWVAIPASEPEGGIVSSLADAPPTPATPWSPTMFSSSKSGMIFPAPSGSELQLLPGTELHVVTPPTPPAANPAPNTPTLIPNVTIMAGSKSITPLIPPKTSPPAQQATPLRP